MTGLKPGAGFFKTLDALPLGDFSTANFIDEYRKRFPAEWQEIEQRYGAGGKGAGQHHTVFTRVAKWLSKVANSGDLDKLDYRPAPETWGNQVVQFWARPGANTSADAAATMDHEFREGSVQLKVHLRRERAWGLARKKKAAFLEKHGNLFCERCHLDPIQKHGPVGEVLIEVHHAATMVSEMNENHRTKLDDLQCLCANCHRLTHAELAEQ